jgi:hypothetical protein
MLLTKNQAVLRGIKIAMKRMRYMDWDASADYLYAKMGEALFMGASDNRADAMQAFLDDKTFKPGIEQWLASLPTHGARAALCLLVPTAMAVAQPIKPAPAFKGTALVAPPTAGWPTNGGNWYNQRYSPLSQIDRTTVASLKGVWRTRLRGSGVDTKYSGEAQPIVHDGVIYVVTGADDVFAIGVESGAILWSYEAQLDPAIDTVCCGWTSRGVGLGDGKIFVGQLDGKLVALDQKTGEVAWSVQAERWQDGMSITSAPLYYDGLVVTGFAGAEYGIRCGRRRQWTPSSA